MKTFKLVVQYDGTDFYGWQHQEGKRTVQGVLEEALKQVLHEKIALEASGRTDKGVHAFAQVCSFVSQNLTFDFSRLPYPVNNLLPPDVSILACEEASEGFHARYHAKQKTYQYCFFTSRMPLPLLERYSLRVNGVLNFERMEKAAKNMEGTHDFSSFCVSRSKKESCVRTVSSCVLVQESENQYCLLVTGNGFLHNMVRIMAGTIVDCGAGKLKPDEIKNIIHAKNRAKAGKTLPANGLSLIEVRYEEEN